MANPRGFIEISRIESGYRPIEERIQDYNEVELMLPEDERKKQAGRCMDCAVPFCHWACPVANVMPEWQAKIYEGDWKAAYDILQSTNNFPEFTGRVCPAPCEVSCVLSINDDPVTIRENELTVIERAFQEGYVKPKPPETRTGKKIAVIGSGPAGLAAADNLNKLGHTVVIYEREDAVGGYLRYGIPDFKLEKHVVDRRVNLMIEEGVIVKTGVEIGVDVSVEELRAQYDAICLTIGARHARDLQIPGRELDGIHFAVDFLRQQNKTVRGDIFSPEEGISAEGKHVVVIGGGDTGSDCVGTSNRHHARSITQVEILPRPPSERPDHQPWPLWATVYKTTSSHKEGCTRRFSVNTSAFLGEDGRVNRLACVEVDWKQENGRWVMTELEGTEFELEADLVLLAMGFVHPEHKGLVHDLGVELTDRGNVRIDSSFMTTVPGVFAGGDSSRGASLVVWAINEGREMADGVHAYLMQS